MTGKRINDEPDVVLKKIESGLKKSNHLYVLFLESSAIEGYLADLLLLFGDPKTIPLKRAQKSFERMSFDVLLNLNNVLGNIENPLYHRMTNFGQERNEFAHKMIKYDIEVEAMKDKLVNLTNEGLALFHEISDTYDDKRYFLSTGKHISDNQVDTEK